MFPVLRMPRSLCARQICQYRWWSLAWQIVVTLSNLNVYYWQPKQTFTCSSLCYFVLPTVIVVSTELATPMDDKWRLSDRDQPGYSDAELYSILPPSAHLAFNKNNS